MLTNRFGVPTDAKGERKGAHRAAKGGGIYGGDKLTPALMMWRSN